jgi:hypothetical protein
VIDYINTYRREVAAFFANAALDEPPHGLIEQRPSDS